MVFKVMACTAEEYAKAYKVHNYAPEEYQAGEIEADTESQATWLLRKMVIRGVFPHGSKLVEE